MSNIKVDTYKLDGYAQRLRTVNSRLTRLDRRLDLLYPKVGWLDLFKLVSADLLTGPSYRIERCASYLSQTSRDFASAERELEKLDPSTFSSVLFGPGLNIASLIQSLNYFNPHTGHPLPGYGPHLANLIHSLNYFNQHTGHPLPGAEVGIASAIMTIVQYGPNEWKKKKEELFKDVELTYGTYESDDHFADKKQNKKSFYQKNADEDFYDQKGTILEGRIEKNAQVSVWEVEGEGKADWGQGSYDVEVLTAEAHAGVSGGLYVYEKDKDGNVKRIFSPGVSAEVGASASVFEAEAEGRIGLGEDNNMLGVYGDAEAKALTAEAEAKVALNSNEIYAGASAEADLVKVSGTAGVSVLGTDVGVSGSLKVGIGAHAEIGYTDGKFKCDVGAALGVGFDIGFEVDIGGTVDALCDVAEGAADFMEDAWDGAKDFFGNLF